jgi:hypothetical protein
VPRYHFNVRQGSNVIRDIAGEELPDLKTAQFEARISARELLLESILAEEEIDGRLIEIADDTGKVIETVKVRDMMVMAPESIGETKH